jgi:hypothetical protein
MSPAHIQPAKTTWENRLNLIGPTMQRQRRNAINSDGRFI